MTDNGITALLTQLHDAMARAHSIGEEDRRLLKKLLADLQAMLGEPGESAGAPQPTMLARLREVILRMEVSHPDISAVLERVSKALADMGI